MQNGGNMSEEKEMIEGYSAITEGESGYRWILFPIDFFREEDGSLPAKDDIWDEAAWHSGFSEFYRGPGLSFGHSPSVRITRTRVLVKQYCGLDI